MTERQKKSVESGVPAAHVITIPNGNHFVFLSNETECLRAVQAFFSKLVSRIESPEYWKSRWTVTSELRWNWSPVAGGCDSAIT
jgi:hypothetical protein